jgi:hypothetical protein
VVLFVRSHIFSANFERQFEQSVIVDARAWKRDLPFASE